MKNSIKHVILILSVLFYCSAIHATQVKSLYQVTLPVQTQSAEEKNAALKQAFSQVLVKVSGSSTILDNPKIKNLTIDSNTLVQQYGYTKLDQGYQLVVQFDQKGIDQLLQQSDVPVWGSERPLLLVWAAIETPNHTTDVLDADSSHSIRTLLNTDAAEREIPLLFPMMDLTDANQISTNDIVNRVVEPLQNASKRYQPDGLLIIHGIEGKSGFNLDAKCVLANQQFDWHIEAPTANDALKGLMNQVADTLSHHYATVITPTVQSQLTLNVTGVGKHNDMMQLMNYLKRLTPVAEVEIKEINGDNVVLLLNLRSSPESMMNIIATEKRLVLVVDQSTGKNITYQWNP